MKDIFYLVATIMLINLFIGSVFADASILKVTPTGSGYTLYQLFPSEDS